MNWESHSLKDLITEAKPGFACGEEDPNGVFQMRMNNVTKDGTLDLSKKRRVPKTFRNLDAFFLKSGDVLFNATNSPDLVGKSAYFSGIQEPVVFSNHFLRICTVVNKLDGRYLAKWLSLLFHHRVFQGMCRQWVNQATVSRESLLSLKIPLPPLAEQRRIAEILDRAEGLRAKRRASLAELETLTQSTFLEMFGNAKNGSQPGYNLLSSCAEVVSGIAKGRKLDGRKTVIVPYLRVANVQAGYLDLAEIKMIEALPQEVDELVLKPGDVVLTEGGDYDKLGRGAMWEGQIEECIHQNHVFRVRPDKSKLLPQYFHEYLQTPEARSYFLRCAKRTTNLASINMTQLRALPVLLPSINEQQEFTGRIQWISKMKNVFKSSLAEFDALFASLQHRAFRGEL